MSAIREWEPLAVNLPGLDARMLHHNCGRETCAACDERPFHVWIGSEERDRWLWVDAAATPGIACGLAIDAVNQFGPRFCLNAAICWQTPWDQVMDAPIRLAKWQGRCMGLMPEKVAQELREATPDHVAVIADEAADEAEAIQKSADVLAGLGINALVVDPLAHLDFKATG